MKCFFFFSTEMGLLILDEILIAFGSQHTRGCYVVRSSALPQPAEMSLMRGVTELGSLQVRYDVQCQISGGGVD